MQYNYGHKQTQILSFKTGIYCFHKVHTKFCNVKKKPDPFPSFLDYSVLYISIYTYRCIYIWRFNYSYWLQVIKTMTIIILTLTVKHKEHVESNADLTVFCLQPIKWVNGICILIDSKVRRSEAARPLQAQETGCFPEARFKADL